MISQRISQQELESYLWGAAVLLRGTIDAGDYKQFIFPLLFYKRLCDVFDEETQAALAESGGDATYASGREQHRFQIPPEAQWREVRQAATNVGQVVKGGMRAIETANPDRLYGIFGDAQWTNKDRLSDAMLRDLVEHFSALDLTIANLPEDELGQGYEYLIKKFADDSGHTAAEFYTNRTVVHLMTALLRPQPGESVYDPTCGSGGMLLSCISHLRRQGKEWRNMRLYGQERNLMTSSIARMNCFLHGIEDFRIERGDTLSEPKFVQGDKLMQFDVVLANPPYSIKQWDRDSFASDPWGRNRYGTPPQGRADYSFFQHILCSLAPKTGRCAILFPHGVLFRQEEAEMRRKLIEADLVECILGLGPNLFYNSPMEACVVVCRTSKPRARRGKVLLINAVNDVTRERAQSFLTDDHIEHIAHAYEHFADEPGFARVASLEEVRAKDGNLSIPLYVAPAPSGGSTVGGRTPETSRTGGLPQVLDAWLMSLRSVAESLRAILPDIPLPALEETLNGIGASAPFDRSTWQRVRIDDVVENLNETCEPGAAGIERFIGLEHLEPGSLHIRQWGNVADGITFTRRCRAGHVLFGKRRAYQRKVAVAEFDAVVSGDIYVLGPSDDRLIPKLLPFLCLSERFFQHAVETSAGSLSPRTSWRGLASLEFALPPLGEQRHITELLWATDEAETNTKNVLAALVDAKTAIVDEAVSIQADPTHTMALIRGCLRVTDGTHQPPKFIDEGIPFFLVKTISSGRVDWNHTKFVSVETYRALTKRVQPKRGDILYTAVGATYGVAVCVDFDQPFAFQRHIAHIIPNPEVLDAEYLTMFLNSRHGRRQSDKAAIGSAQPTVTLGSLGRFQVPDLPLRSQRLLVERVRKVGRAQEALTKALDTLRHLRTALLNEVFR